MVVPKSLPFRGLSCDVLLISVCCLWPFFVSYLFHLSRTAVRSACSLACSFAISRCFCCLDLILRPCSFLFFCYAVRTSSLSRDSTHRPVSSICALHWADFNCCELLDMRIHSEGAARRSCVPNGARQQNDWRLDSGTEHGWGRIWALLIAILLWDQGLRLFRPNRLSLGLLSIPHRMCLLLILESDMSISFCISFLPLSRKCLLCLSPPDEAAGFEGGFASCWRNCAKPRQSLRY